jgi:outer membrane protein OmpA-like peptidoglycan-associated protein
MIHGRDRAHARARLVASVACLVVPVLGTGAVSAYDPDGVPERIFEIQPYIGAFLPDKNVRYENSGLLGVRGSVNNSSWWALEANFAWAPAQQRNFSQGTLSSYNSEPGLSAQGDTLGWVITNMETNEGAAAVATDLLMFGGAVTAHLMDGTFRPFLTAGGGYMGDLNAGDSPGTLSNGYIEAGGGLKYFRRNGWSIRLDVRDLIMQKEDLARPYADGPLIAGQHDVVSGGGKDKVLGREPYDPDEYRGKRWLHNWAISLAVSVPFGWAWKDGDGDHVADRFDQCLTTAPGVVVSVDGCGIDTDQDGVFDGLDQCANTPLGATVDITGCPSDTDGDGVLDGIDQMDDTPVGALVDAQGRHRDTDGDGVFDGLDQCDDTPPGASIDLDGCSQNPLEDQLLRGETIVLAGVTFEPGTDEIKPLSYHYVNRIARLLEYWTGSEERPQRVEVGVHTDGVGAEDYNLDLSQRRAARLRTYMLENFYGMAQNNLVAVGYGETMPLGDDETEEGRDMNRRVEIRSLGPGDPPEQYDWGADDFADDEALPVTGADPAADPGTPADGTAVPPEPELPPEPEMPLLEEPEMPEPDLD